MNSAHTLDKKQTARRVERASASYDQAAVLQREISNRMLARLEYIKYRPMSLSMLAAVRLRQPATGQTLSRQPVDCVDIAWAMLSHARPTPPGGSVVAIATTRGLCVRRY